MAKMMTAQPDLLAGVDKQAPSAKAKPAKKPSPPAKPKREIAKAKPEPAPRQEVAIHRPKPAPIETPQTMLQALARAAADPRCDPAKMRELFAIHKEIEAEEARRAFMVDFIALEAELPTINKTGRIEIEARERQGRMTKAQSTPYATYNEINRVCKPILRKHGFTIWFSPDISADDKIMMRGYLNHRKGHQETGAMRVPLETGGSKNNLQGAGSSLSYTKRYIYIALLNIISEAPEDKDDDGNFGKAKEPPPKLAQKQIDDLRESIEDCGVGLHTFLDKYQIAMIEDLPPNRYEEAMKACRDYKSRRGDRK